MLDHGTVHVDDIQGTIGAVGEIDGAKPFIAGCQKLNFLTARSRREGCAIGLQHIAVYHIAGRFAGETIAAKLLGQQIAAINRHAAGGGELPFMRGGRRPRATDGENARAFT